MKARFVGFSEIKIDGQFYDFNVRGSGSGPDESPPIPNLNTSYDH